jgi:hypothetical protein
MTILLDKHNLYSTFNVDSFDELEISINNISPSMAEYYLNDLSSINTNSLHLNKTNIEKSLNLDSYSLYLDYSDNIYLEILNTQNEYESNTLW